MNWNLETLLIFHILIIGILLLIIAIMLVKRSQFHWNSVGFWSWVSFLLYFELYPIFSLINHDIYRFKLHLSIAGGINRGLWILFVLFIGILGFFISYFRTPITIVNWGIKTNNINIPMILVCLFFISFGTYSLLAYRALVLKTGEVVLEEGRFLGEVTGYEYGGYKFLFIPIIMAVLSSS